MYEKVHTFARLLVAQKARTLQGNMQKHGSEAKEAQPAPGAETFEPSVPVIGTLEQFAQASFVLPPNYVAQLSRRVFVYRRLGIYESTFPSLMRIHYSLCSGMWATTTTASCWFGIKGKWYPGLWRRRALLSSRVVCLCDRVSSCVMPPCPCVAVSLVSVKRPVLRVLCPRPLCVAPQCTIA